MASLLLERPKNMIATGSPGTRGRIRKTSVNTANQTGIVTNSRRRTKRATVSAPWRRQSSAVRTEWQVTRGKWQVASSARFPRATRRLPPVSDDRRRTTRQLLLRQPDVVQPLIVL